VEAGSDLRRAAALVPLAEEEARPIAAQRVVDQAPVESAAAREVTGSGLGSLDPVLLGVAAVPAVGGVVLVAVAIGLGWRMRTRATSADDAGRMSAG